MKKESNPPPPPARSRPSPPPSPPRPSGSVALSPDDLLRALRYTVKPYEVAAADLIESLQAENARLQSIIDDGSVKWAIDPVQNIRGETVYGIRVVNKSPIPVQKSPAVAVPDGLRELIAACRQIGFPVVTEGMKCVIDDMQSALSRVQNSIGAPSTRITEQDAREIVEYPSGTGELIVSDPDVNGVVIVRDESGEYRRVASSAIKKLNKPESVGG